MIKIVTDSTAYLPQETVESLDIRVVPLYVHFGDEAFREGIDMTDEQFYARLKAENICRRHPNPRRVPGGLQGVARGRSRS